MQNDEDPQTPTDRAEDAVLAPFFAAARAARPEPCAALTARILADAEATHRIRAARPRGSTLAQVVALLGGWGALGGLASAALAGLWIGVQTPAVIDTLTGAAAAPEVDLLADVGLLLEEG